MGLFVLVCLVKLPQGGVQEDCHNTVCSYLILLSVVCISLSHKFVAAIVALVVRQRVFMGTVVTIALKLSEIKIFSVLRWYIFFCLVWQKGRESS